MANSGHEIWWHFYRQLWSALEGNCYHPGTIAAMGEPGRGCFSHAWGYG